MYLCKELRSHRCREHNHQIFSSNSSFFSLYSSCESTPASGRSLSFLSFIRLFGCDGDTEIMSCCLIERGNLVRTVILGHRGSIISHRGRIIFSYRGDGRLDSELLCTSLRKFPAIARVPPVPRCSFSDSRTFFAWRHCAQSYQCGHQARRASPALLSGGRARLYQSFQSH